MWEYIDKIMTHPDYDKSFNKVINSALLFGLPILYKRLFDTVEIDGEETPVSVPNEYNEDAFYFPTDTAYERNARKRSNHKIGRMLAIQRASGGIARRKIGR